MLAKRGDVSTDDIREWMHQPVCVVLKNGTFYIGWITGANRKALTLAGRKGVGKLNAASIHRQGETKVKVSALVPGAAPYNSFEGGGWADPFGYSPLPEGAAAGGGSGSGGFGGFMGFMKQVWPGIQIGLGIVRAVMPLMRGLKL